MSIAETWHPWPTVDHWFTSSSYESGSHHESRLTTTWILEMIRLLRGLEPTEMRLIWMFHGHGFQVLPCNNTMGAWCEGSASRIWNQGFEELMFKQGPTSLSLSVWALQIDNLTQPLLGTVQHTNELVSSGRGEGDPKGCCFDFNRWSQATNIFHVADLSCRAADLVAIRCCKFACLPRPPVIY